MRLMSITKVYTPTHSSGQAVEKILWRSNLDHMAMTGQERYQKYYEKHGDRIRETKRKAALDYYHANIKEVRRKQNERASAPEAKKKAREYQLRKKFGLSMADYEAMLLAQGGKCAICQSEHSGRKDRNNFSVDHDHSTGKVRGLLCSGCNTGIGNLRESPAILLRAAEYLRVNTQ